MRKDVIRADEVNRNLNQITKELNQKLEEGKNKEFEMLTEINELRAKIREY